MTGISRLLKFIDVVFPFYFNFVNGWFILLPMHSDNLGRNTDNRYITRNICYDNRCSTDFGIFTDFYRSNDLGMSRDESSFTNGRMAFANILPCPAKSYPVVEKNPFFNDSRLPNYKT